MLFADDSYIYCRANEEEARRVLEMLKVFENAAGQKVNLDKSSVFFSKNTLPETKGRVLNTLKMRMTNDKSFYLGLPSMIDRNKSAIFGYLKDKIRWEGKWFSGAGKEILIKTGLQAISTYTMSVFMFPNQVCQDIESIINNFW